MSFPSLPSWSSALVALTLAAGACSSPDTHLATDGGLAGSDGPCSSDGCSSTGKCRSADDCDDKEPCTDDTCVAGVCEQVNNSLPCDDGQVCTRDDTCTNGVCAGELVSNCPLPAAELIFANDLAPCAVRSDGSNHCWGLNWYGGATVPNAGPLRAWSNDGMYVGALDVRGRLYDNMPPVLWGEDFTALAIGDSLTCALHASGKILCGSAQAGSTGPRVVGHNYVALHGGGGNHFCAIDSDRLAACFTVINEDVEPWPAPPALGQPTDIVFTATAGGPAACALYADKPPLCFGAPLPAAQQPPADTWQRISFSTDRGAWACGLHVDGHVACWGDVATTRPDGSPLAPGESPLAAPAGSFRDVSAGRQACALAERDLFCWGGYGDIIPGWAGFDLDLVELGAMPQAKSKVLALLSSGDIVSLDTWYKTVDYALPRPGSAKRFVSSATSGKAMLTAEERLIEWGLVTPLIPRASQTTTFSDLGGRWSLFGSASTGPCGVRRDASGEPWGLQCAAGLPPSVAGLIRLARQESILAPLCGFDQQDQLLCESGADDPAQAVGAPGQFSQAAVDSSYVCGLMRGAQGVVQCEPHHHPAVKDYAAFTVDGLGDLSELSLAGSGDRPLVCGLDRKGIKRCEEDGVLREEPGRYAALGHHCDIMSSGAVACQGSAGAPDELFGAVRLELTPAISSLGEDLWCVIWRDGSVRCAGLGGTTPLKGPGLDFFGINSWGSCERRRGDALFHCDFPSSGWEQIPPSEIAARDLSVGWLTVCAALASGELNCWSSDPSAKVGPFPSGDYVQVDSGIHDVCAKTAGGTVACAAAQTANRPPLSPAALGDVEEIEVGRDFVCLRSGDGRVACTTDGTFELIAPAVRFVSLSAGNRHVCGLLPDGQARCFGEDWYGETRAPLDERFDAVVAGNRYSCGVAEGQPLRCWGKIWYD